MNEEIDFDNIEFGEPIEEREPNYRDGYIQGIYRARNIIDSKQKEIERLNKRIKELEEGFKATTEDLCEESTKIEKAIEYINSSIENDDIEELKSARHIMLWNEDLDKLLNILKGSDKE